MNSLNKLKRKINYEKISKILDKKIRINSIIACMIKTNMYEGYKNKTGKDLDDIRFSTYSLGIGDPLDIANAITYLLSNCSKIVTGTGWVIDSGATA